MLEEQSAPPPGEAPRPVARWRLWLRPLLIGLAVAAANVAVFVLLPPELLSRLGNFGYLGAFASAAFANATVIVPVPYYPLIIRLGQTLDPWGVGLAAAAGSVLGELVAYFVGRSGRQAVEETGFYLWVQRQLSHRWRAPLVLFALSAPPNPVFDVAGLLAGALGVPLWVFVVSTFLGRTVRMATIVFVGQGLGGG
ncbi:MAG TPA: VTT domain-containing protein [Chloroflexaceae bacterium]|nr:VTT domain-containing protein [Chloroflexaceae bacterium]